MQGWQNNREIWDNMTSGECPTLGHLSHFENTKYFYNTKIFYVYKAIKKPLN